MVGKLDQLREELRSDHPSLRLLVTLVVTTIGSTLMGCRADRSPQQESEAARQAAHVQQVVASGGIVDSIVPVAEALRRFRVEIPKVDTLRHGSRSTRALVSRLAQAVTAHDTAELNAMVLDRAEFAWLFYESSSLARPPYEAPPALLWGQIRTASDDGARKLLARLGGKTIRVSDLQCGEELVEGENRLHQRCTVRFEAPGAPVLDGNLFGTIIERQGRFKFVGLGNRI